jgi:hypothetical protein
MLELGSWRSFAVLVVTGTASKAIRKRDPKNARTALAHGPDGDLPAATDMARLPSLRILWE